MTQKEYKQLQYNYVHCAGTGCKRSGECMRHTAYKAFVESTRQSCNTTNPSVITGSQPCPLFDLERRETYAWGITNIYDNIRVADLHRARQEVKSIFGSKTYYDVKLQRRPITEAEQKEIRQALTEMGYDGKAIEFDRYEQQNPVFMRMYRKK